jgi:cyclase
MLRIRVIPVLLLENGGLVKTVKFDKKTYIGDPINAIKIFNEKEVDELILLDINASKTNKEPNYKLLEYIATECFMPFSYGGGVKNLKQIRKLFSIGIEKVVINAALHSDVTFLKEAVQIYGSQSIVASVDIKKNFFGQYGVYSYLDKKIVTKNIKNFIQKLETLGIGEIVFNDVNNDGVMNGYNIELIKLLNSLTTVPTVFCGGSKNFNDLIKASKIGAMALGAGSMFVYNGVHRAVLINYPKQTQLQELNNIVI